MHSLKNIAAYILNKYENQVSPMKLQKLLYYVKVWTMVAGEKVIDSNDAFFAWKHGPVNPGVYHQYKQYGGSTIKEKPPYDPLHHNESALVNFILDSYSFYSAVTLSKTTHSEEPWINNKDFNGRITNQEILDYYSKEQFAKNFPLNSFEKYYPPNTTSHFSFVFDMNETDEASKPYFSSLNEYLEKLNSNKEKATRYINSM